MSEISDDPAASRIARATCRWVSRLPFPPAFCAYSGRSCAMKETIPMGTLYRDRTLHLVALAAVFHDSYRVETEWQNAGETYALERSNGFSTWKSDGGESGVFSKTVVYFNELSDDGKSFVGQLPLDAITRYTQNDPIWGVMAVFSKNSLAPLPSSLVAYC